MNEPQKKVPITQKGYEDLQKKLAEKKMEFETMPAIIAQAREKGDLKENADYHAAREKQGMLKAEIDRISGELTNSQIIDPAILPSDKITFGKRVTLLNADNKEITYDIVGPSESDSGKQCISVTSLLAKGLLGKQAGEVCTVIVPAGTQTYTIKKIAVLSI